MSEPSVPNSLEESLQKFSIPVDDLELEADDWPADEDLSTEQKDALIGLMTDDMSCQEKFVAVRTQLKSWVNDGSDAPDTSDLE